MGKGSRTTRTGTASNPNGLNASQSVQNTSTQATGAAANIVVSPINQLIRAITSKAVTAQNATSTIKHIEAEIQSRGYSSIHPFKIATMGTDIAQIFEQLTGVPVQSREIYSSVKALTHHQGGQKAARGKELTWAEKAQIPQLLPSMDIFEHDGVFVFTDYKIKVIVEPNREIKIHRKRKIVANHLSASKVIDMNEFVNGVYRPIKVK